MELGICLGLREIILYLPVFLKTYYIENYFFIISFFLYFYSFSTVYLYTTFNSEYGEINNNITNSNLLNAINVPRKDYNIVHNRLIFFWALFLEEECVAVKQYAFA